MKYRVSTESRNIYVFKNLYASLPRQAGMAKALNLSSNGRMPAWVRTSFLTFVSTRAQFKTFYSTCLELAKKNNLNTIVSPLSNLLRENNHIELLRLPT